jgi:transcriptional regulator NrdR family protein
LHHDGTIRRRRACIKCGYRFSTSEDVWLNPKKQTKVIDLPVHAPIRKAEQKKEIDWQWAAENMSDEELEELIHDNA